MNEKLSYFLLSLKKTALRQGLGCPSCGSEVSGCESRKYWVTTLRRCDRCKILFRAPVTTEDENRAYYQADYKEGFTTDMPEPAALDAMKRALFKGSPKDFQPHVDLFRALGLKPGAAVLDFGCSWGYGSWQFMQAGFAVKGFEISEPRGKYARRMLGVEVVNDLEGLAGTFDLVFSSHVLEHVPAVAATLGRMRELLKPGGLLVILTPNGSAAYRKREPIFWRKAWGLKHPYFLDDGYYRSFFADWPYYLASGPADLEQVRVWAASSGQRMGDLGCSELRLIARKTASVTRGQG